MGTCSDDCNCLVDGDRGILVTGTGDAGTGYVVSPDVHRNLTMWVATRNDLPTLTTDDAGTFAHVGDTGIDFVWTGTAWHTTGPQWSRADFDGLTIGVAPATSVGFTLAGSNSYAIWAKGYVDTLIPPATSVVYLLELLRSDSGATLDYVYVDATNNAAGPTQITRPFSLLATIGLGAPTDVTGIVLRHSRTAGATTAELKQGRIFASRISGLDTTIPFP